MGVFCVSEDKFVCRICELSFPVAELQNHTKNCLMWTKWDIARARWKRIVEDSTLYSKQLSSFQFCCFFFCFIFFLFFYFFIIIFFNIFSFFKYTLFNPISNRRKHGANTSHYEADETILASLKSFSKKMRTVFFFNLFSFSFSFLPKTKIKNSFSLISPSLSSFKAPNNPSHMDSIIPEFQKLVSLEKSLSLSKEIRKIARALLVLFEEKRHTAYISDQIKKELLELGFSVNHKNFELSLRSAQISDFEFLKPISKGAFGRVFLGRRKVTNDLYAIKVFFVLFCFFFCFFLFFCFFVFFLFFCFFFCFFVFFVFLFFVFILFYFILFYLFFILYSFFL